MRIQEITTKSALVRSRIPGVSYVINPYLGCGHGCRYCYATFMRKYSRHNQNAQWGEFVEVKKNIADILRNELRRKRKTGTAFLSSVCDPYQPAERRYKLTRQCLELLREYGWGIDILTKSPLVTRDIDILSSSLDVSVGLSISTDDDHVRKILEPNSPPIGSRVVTLQKLRDAGIRTSAFVAPMLPMNPEKLYRMISPYIESVMFDSLNYKSQVAGIFIKNGWGYALSPEYASRTSNILRHLFNDKVRDEN